MLCLLISESAILPFGLLLGAIALGCIILAGLIVGKIRDRQVIRRRLDEASKAWKRDAVR